MAAPSWGPRSRQTLIKSYVSPEVLKDLPANFEVDLWALGCIIFEMYTGEPIFQEATEFLTF